MNMLKSVVLGSFLAAGLGFCASAEETSAPVPEIKAPAPATEVKSKDQVVALWDMKDFANGAVESKVEGGGTLKIGNSPEPVSVENVAGLRFAGKQKATLNADANTCASLFDGPFSLRIKILFDAPPLGVLGGIFGRHGNGGFRVMYAKEGNFSDDMIISLDVPESPQGNGKSTGPLKLGKWYDYEVRFDGKNVFVLVDGKIASQGKSAIPKKCTESVTIGYGHGKDYFLDGVIASIELSKIEPAK